MTVKATTVTASWHGLRHLRQRSAVGTTEVIRPWHRSAEGRQMNKQMAMPYVLDRKLDLVNIEHSRLQPKNICNDRARIEHLSKFTVACIGRKKWSLNSVTWFRYFLSFGRNKVLYYKPHILSALQSQNIRPYKWTTSLQMQSLAKVQSLGPDRSFFPA